MTLCYITGIPSSGKTSVGHALADLLHVPFTESDDVIEQVTGKSVDTVLLYEGEDRLAQLYEQILPDLLGREGIVAFGGGVFDRDKPVEIMREHLSHAPTAFIVLDMDMPTMAKRLDLNRPRSIGLGAPRAMLRTMAQKRKERWGIFHPYILDTSGINPHEAAVRLSQYEGIAS